MQISRQTYEEYFLLYIDEELNAEERAVVEIFVQEHPDLKEELVVLRQSVFQADENIVFENKELLFRGNENKRAVVIFGWKKIVVAAALLIFIGFGGWFYVSRSSSGNDRLRSVVSEVKPSVQPGIQNKKIIPVPVVEKPAAAKIEVTEFKKKTIIKNLRDIEVRKEKIIKLLPVEEKTPDMVSMPEVADIAHDVAVNDNTHEKINIPVQARELNEFVNPIKPENIYYAGENNSSENNKIYFANTSFSKRNSLKVVFRKTSRIIDRITTLQ